MYLFKYSILTSVLDLKPGAILYLYSLYVEVYWFYLWFWFVRFISYLFCSVSAYHCDLILYRSVIGRRCKCYVTRKHIQSWKICRLCKINSLTFGNIHVYLKKEFHVMTNLILIIWLVVRLTQLHTCCCVLYVVIFSLVGTCALC